MTEERYCKLKEWCKTTTEFKKGMICLIILLYGLMLKEKYGRGESRVPFAIRSVKNSEEIFEAAKDLTVIHGPHGEHNVILSSVYIYHSPKNICII